jgi:hypothetical protein
MLYHAIPCPSRRSGYAWLWPNTKCVFRSCQLRPNLSIKPSPLRTTFKRGCTSGLSTLIRNNPPDFRPMFTERGAMRAKGNFDQQHFQSSSTSPIPVRRPISAMELHTRWRRRYLSLSSVIASLDMSSLVQVEEGRDAAGL